MSKMTDRSHFGPNPFTPEVGREPPHLAGRDEVLGWWQETLADRQPKEGRMVLMYGPRGMGKTVVMSRFGKLAAAAGCDVVRTNVTLLDQGQAGLAERLLATVAKADYRQESRMTGKRGGAKASLGVASADGQTEVRHAETFTDPMAAHGSLAAKLQAQALARPLVVLVDEAHAAKDLDALQALANAGQEVAEVAPFFLLLVGTPGLPQTLKDANCTFTERTRMIGMGLLDAEGAREAIRTPLTKAVWKLQGGARLALKDDALDAVVQDSQGYPYFLQIWGYEIWEYAAARDKDGLTLEDIANVQAAVEQERKAFYAQRGREITRDRTLLAAANAVTLVFEQYAASGDSALLEQHVIADEIAASLESAYPDRQALDLAKEQALDELIKIGFVWLPPKTEHMAPSIPSYMSYAKRVYNDRVRRHGDPLATA